MSTLQIRKLQSGAFKHVDSIDGDFFLGRFSFKEEFNKAFLIEAYGAKRREYLVTEITVYDYLGTAEPFTNFTDLENRLVELGYTGISINGMLPTASSYVSSDADNSLGLGADNKLFIKAIESVQAGTNITIDDTDPLNPIINSSGGGGSGINVIRGSNNNMSITASELVATYASTVGNWCIPTTAVTKSGLLITGPAIEIQSERVASTSTISSVEIKYLQEDGAGGIVFRLYAFKYNDGANTIYDVRRIFEKTITGTLYRLVNKTYLTADMLDANLIAGEQLCLTVQLSSGTPARAKGFNILIKH